MTNSLELNSRSSNSRGLFLIGLILLVGSALSTNAQITGNAGKNNPYSPSPSGKIKEQKPSPTPTQITSAATPPRAVLGEVAFVMQGQKSAPRDDSRNVVVAGNTSTAKSLRPVNTAPKDTYKIGVGDVLFVNLKNSPQGSGYYTVAPNGTIDYPLAGENVVVAGKTLDGVEDALTTGITLFSNPQLEIKVREYASHKVTVFGLVENAGEKSLQREAIPMFVIRADAVVNPKATKALIKRAPLSKEETYILRDPNTDNILVYPGNSIEFVADPVPVVTSLGSYSISGDIRSGGQKEMLARTTLSQAVAAASPIKGEPKKATIKRKDSRGILTSVECNLRAIKEGKVMDPVLVAGDVIEIRN